MTDDAEQEAGRWGRFAIMVLALFGLIVLAVALLAIFGPDSGLLPFDYEGA